MKFRCALFLVVLFAAGGCSTWNSGNIAEIDDESKTKLLYNQLIYSGPPDVAQLTLFFTKMPKGGDLHHHCPRAVSRDSMDKRLEIMARKAKQENVSYIECMLKSVDYSYRDDSFDEEIRNAETSRAIKRLLSKLKSKIKSDGAFRKLVEDFVEEVDEFGVGVDDDRFMMRFQIYAPTYRSPSMTFSSLYAAFKAAAASDLIVGVNIVGPENGVTSIEDYLIHMRMFPYLKKRFPYVHIALHADEPTLGMVRPKNAPLHNVRVMELTGAQRIGHKVDLSYEEDALNLGYKIKKNSAVVEFTFASNEYIPGARDQRRPYRIYAAYDIPLVITTSDLDVSRNNLSGEYVLLAARYKPEYKNIKKYVYNSIKYSFLSWGYKHRLKKSLDSRFERFEKEMADNFDSLVD